MKRVVVLGATGSIGLSTADVIRRHPDRFQAYALVGHRNVDRMVELVAMLRPEYVVMTDELAAEQLRSRLPEARRVLAGMAAAEAMAADEGVDIVVAAMVGAAGLPAALAAVRAGKRVALANKECLVTAGRVFMRHARQYGAEIMPVDSEHAAVHQALQGHDGGSVTRIILTASGGPFRDRDPETLHDVTPAEAVAHPNWEMGAKISVDSATMMNKALELIEARWLFDAAPDKLDAIIHPESIVHAMVEYADGSVLAQLAVPDMRMPIAYALQANPRIATGIARLDLVSLGRLSFQPVDHRRFPAMRLVADVLHGEDSLAISMNAANEVANAAFRAGRIPFTSIVAVVERVLARSPRHNVSTLDEVWSLDHQARAWAEEMIAHA
ncbi:MAG: 1-deoxy-D-xylulose-5-phosphate reductoisomerase [Zetaproteobacteria bacterium]|nr:MAG: 1-deoxy-D-xylulose-5-phosphate reductoisomerase [Zetaproteobacteria bacterium]